MSAHHTSPAARCGTFPAVASDATRDPPSPAVRAAAERVWAATLSMPHYETSHLDRDAAVLAAYVLGRDA